MLIRSLIPLGCVAAALMLGSCRHGAATRAEAAQASGGATEVDAGAEPPLEERWIGPGAADGDGSRERPLASIEEALASSPGRALHLRLLPGTYTGTWELPAGTVIEGAPGIATNGRPGQLERRLGVRLESPEKDLVPLLRAEGTVTLKRLTLVGGDPTLDGPGPWSLEDIRVESRSCISMSEGRLSADKVIFVANRGGGTCLQLEGHARAALTGVFFEGPWREALALSGSATANAWLLRVRGSEWAVRQRGGSLNLERVELEGSGEAGLYVAGGELTVQDVRVEGYEYGIMAGREARVRGERVRLQGAKRAGLAMVGAQVELNDVEVSRVRGGGAFAGIQLVGGEATLSDVRIQDVAAAGLSQRGGNLTLGRVSIDGVTAAADGSEGAGLSIRLGTAILSSWGSVDRVGGPGALVAENGSLVAPQLSLRGDAGGPGVVVETGGTLEVEELVVEERSSPALLVTERSKAKVSRLLIASKDGANAPVPAWTHMIVATCEEGAQVHLGILRLGRLWGVVEDAPHPALPCLHELSGRASPGP